MQRRRPSVSEIRIVISRRTPRTRSRGVMPWSIISRRAIIQTTRLDPLPLPIIDRGITQSLITNLWTGRKFGRFIRRHSGLTFLEFALVSLFVDGGCGLIFRTIGISEGFPIFTDKFAEVGEGYGTMSLPMHPLSSLSPVSNGNQLFHLYHIGILILQHLLSDQSLPLIFEKDIVGTQWALRTIGVLNDVLPLLLLICHGFMRGVHLQGGWVVRMWWHGSVGRVELRRRIWKGRFDAVSC
eukprot:CCRYP_009636-RC/>CCRYP_009636-RC protein AED:0.04 eAED:0.04 QI:4494/1/1/1/0.11/0.1/10/599/239